MWKQVVLVLITLIFAFGVLLTSIFRTASVKYGFSSNQYAGPLITPEPELVEYYLPFPGKVLPGSPLWSVKAIRDRLWLVINTNDSKEAELLLLFADKRIASAFILFEQGNFAEGYSIYTKAEKYLEEASLAEEVNRNSGLDTSEFLIKIASASLKHYELGNNMLNRSSDEVRPSIIKTQEYSKKVFERSRNALLEKGITPPENPFDWE